MTGFPLKIVTPDGLEFDGIAEQLIVRTITGDMGIMAKHADCVAPLGMGEATVVIDGQRRRAACIGGMVSVINGAVNLVPTTFEWAEEIDVARAEASGKRAQAILNNKNASDTEIKLAKARMKRALVRMNVRK
ncbi:MAG: ATP synthase F1 subunit epsilon [Lachnospiraceae bacterium]|nr:ATP synthase F1 subunit epsilon [Lachnospiraceae bacterium]